MFTPLPVTTYILILSCFSFTDMDYDMKFVVKRARRGIKPDHRTEFHCTHTLFSHSDPIQEY